MNEEKIDFGKVGKPFVPAAKLQKRLKLFLWGDSGSGKTTLSLQFPHPVLIDMEGGADLYGGDFRFDVIKTVLADDVVKAINWLSLYKHDYRTVIIDPITIYWDALQKKWSDILLQRNKGSKGYKFEFYDLQPHDWMTVKAEFKDLLRQLIGLDMNVIVTSRQKIKYADTEFMKIIGETFDCEKTLPYMFDTVVHLILDGKKHIGVCTKDRSNHLPKEPFEINYRVFENLFGKETLVKKAETIKLIGKPAVERIANLLKELKFSEDSVKKSLANYGADVIEELNETDAKTILSKLEFTLESKKEEIKTNE